MNDGPQQPHAPGSGQGQWQGQGQWHGQAQGQGPAWNPDGTVPAQGPAQNPGQGGGHERPVLHGQVIPSARQDPSQQPFVPQQPVSPDPSWAPPQAPQPQPQPQQSQQPDLPGSGAGAGEPDWSALAEENEAGARKRRTLLMVGGGVLAAGAVAGIVATAVVASKTDGKPKAKPSASAPADLPGASLPPDPEFPTVTPPPPADPLEFISSAAKDTAPLTPETLFPGRKLTLGDRSYAKGATSSTGSCASAASGTLGAVLANNGCKQVLRATYTANGTAVTIGVAVFDSAADAQKVKAQAKGNIQSLPGGGVPTFCRAVACRLTTNAVGRYAYFTVSGYTDGRAVPASDTRARQTAADINTFTFNRIVQRGRDAAAADAGTG
ncbi:hypothetical protein [Streptomyces sp. HB2AG]|uniref:hypothetical protein n=1 Tax=Streptomyces sp. HB2AG TaxID=2983400 RepID=UPI0022AAE769|nr:hypothetical protein [Streptomyces sp. HB2AG]MCZ2523903.1 hypothetical protein [Streptomyces sp. HB2AG]